MKDFFKLDLPLLDSEIEDSLLTMLANVTIEQFKDSNYLSELKTSGANAIGKQVTGIDMVSSGLVRYSAEFEKVKHHFNRLLSVPFVVDLQVCKQINNQTIGPIGHPFHRYNLDPAIIYTLTPHKFQFYKQSKSLPNHHVLLDRKNLTKSNTYLLDKSQIYAVNWRNVILEEVYSGTPTYKIVLTFPGQHDLSFLKFL